MTPEKIKKIEDKIAESEANKWNGIMVLNADMKDLLRPYQLVETAFFDQTNFNRLALELNDELILFFQSIGQLEFAQKFRNAKEKHEVFNRYIKNMRGA